MSHWTYLVYFLYMYILYIYIDIDIYVGYCYSRVLPSYSLLSEALQEKSTNESRGLSQAPSIADQELILLIVNLPKFLQNDIFIVDPTIDVT